MPILRSSYILTLFLFLASSASASSGCQSFLLPGDSSDIEKILRAYNTIISTHVIPSLTSFELTELLNSSRQDDGYLFKVPESKTNSEIALVQEGLDKLGEYFRKKINENPSQAKEWTARFRHELETRIFEVQSELSKQDIITESRANAFDAHLTLHIPEEANADWMLKMALAPDSNSIAVASGTHLLVWNKFNQKAPPHILKLNSLISGVSYSLDSQKLAIVHRTLNYLTLLPVVHLPGKTLTTRVQAGSQISSSRFLKNGEEIAVLGISGELRIVNMLTQEPVTEFKSVKIINASFAETGDAFVSPGVGVYFWNRTLNRLESVDETLTVRLLLASDDGSCALVGGITRLNPREVSYYIDTKSKIEASLQGPTTASGTRRIATAFAISADKQRIAVAFKDGDIWIWKAHNLVKPSKMFRSSADVLSLAFSHDNSKLVAASPDDNQIKIWNIDED